MSFGQINVAVRARSDTHNQGERLEVFRRLSRSGTLSLSPSADGLRQLRTSRWLDRIGIVSWLVEQCAKLKSMEGSLDCLPLNDVDGLSCRLPLTPLHKPFERAVQIAMTATPSSAAARSYAGALRGPADVAFLARGTPAPRSINAGFAAVYAVLECCSLWSTPSPSSFGPASVPALSDVAVLQKHWRKPCWDKARAIPSRLAKKML